MCNTNLSGNQGSYLLFQINVGMTSVRGFIWMIYLYNKYVSKWTIVFFPFHSWSENFYEQCVVQCKILKHVHFNAVINSNINFHIYITIVILLLGVSNIKQRAGKKNLKSSKLKKLRHKLRKKKET